MKDFHSLEPRYALQNSLYFTDQVVPGIANAINYKLAEQVKDVPHFSLITFGVLV